MSQKDKELLLKDLCGRLPYGVICQIYDPQQDYGEDIFDALLININAWFSHCNFWGCSETDPYKIEQVKPYLRPMSSMTDEEKEELNNVTVINCNEFEGCSTLFDETGFDWLNKNHFNYRGLIPMGLAIAVTEENNPYGVQR